MGNRNKVHNIHRKMCTFCSIFECHQITMKSLVPEETSVEKYLRSKIEGNIQQYNSERHIKRIQYCSDEYNWENDVSI